MGKKKSQYNELEKTIEDEATIRTNKLSDIACKALKIMTEGEVLIGESIDGRGQLKEEFSKFYSERINKVLELVRDSDIPYTEVKELAQLMIQPIDVMKTYMERSLEVSIEKAQNALWGKNHLDVSMKDIDKVLEKIKK